MPGIVRTAEESALDSRILRFGKYKGKTADEISEFDPQYLVWAYTNIKDRPPCSLPLAKKCGYVDMSSRGFADTKTRDIPLADRNEKIREAPRMFDNYDDDDVPF